MAPAPPAIAPYAIGPEDGDRPARGRRRGPRERARLAASVALGASLARARTSAKLAFALAGLTVVWAVGAAVVLAGRDAGKALADVGAASATLLAWGAGILVAVPASMRALREDRESGVRALLRARGVSATAYATGRVSGLALVLFAVVGGGALVAGGASVLAASRVGVAAAALHGLVVALAYSAAYALVVAPIALAALGARSRPGGFLRFLAVILVPLLLESWAASLAPDWGHLLSVPTALTALRAAVAHGLDVAGLARALVVLAAFAAVSFVLVLAEIAALDSETEPSPGEHRP